MNGRAFSDVLLVGFDFSNGVDKTTLLIGRKRPNETVDVINVVQGAYAAELYKKLTGKKTQEVKSDGIRE